MSARRISFHEGYARFEDGYGRQCRVEIDRCQRLYVFFEDIIHGMDGGIVYDDELIEEMGRVFRVFYEHGVLTLDDLNEPVDDDKY